MKLYLMRHCEPQPGDPMDGTRKLTAAGIAQANQMAAFMVREVGRVDTVITSPFVRAAQTAEIMAKALGSPVVADTRMLQPDGEPEEMWAEITRLAQQAEEVLVVGHHPSIMELAQWLIAYGEKDALVGGCFKFKHGSVAHIDCDELGGVMHWFVPPKLVERAEDLPIEETLRENLSSRERSGIVSPLHRKLRNATGTRFRAQARLVNKALAHTKAELDADDTPDTPPASVHHGIEKALGAASAATLAFLKAYDKTTQAAYENGATEVSDKLGVANAGYLEADGDALAAELDKTTLDRLTSVIATVYKDDPSYDALVDAVKGVFADALTSRADMTAVTEISTAWNQGAADAAQSAIDAGATLEKRWVTEDDPCPECEENEAEDWIDFDEDFSSGDDQPPAHPNCQCSLEMRTTKA